MHYFRKKYSNTSLIKILSYIIVHSDFKNVLKKFVDQGILRNEVEEYFELFKKAKEQNKVKEEKEKNIDHWGKGPFQEFKDFVDKLKDTKTKSEEKRLKKMEGAELVAENDDYWVYKITNHDAVRTYGSGTKWCITQEQPRWWNKYRIRNDFYFYIAKHKNKSDPLYKVAMTIDRKGKTTYFNAPDAQIKEPPTEVDFTFPPKSVESNSEIERIAAEIEEYYKAVEENENEVDEAVDAYGGDANNFSFNFDRLDSEEEELIKELAELLNVDPDDYEDEDLKNEVLECCSYDIDSGYGYGGSIASTPIGNREDSLGDDLMEDLRSLSEEDLAAVQVLLDDADVYIDVSDPSSDITFEVGREDDYLIANLDLKKLENRVKELKLVRKIDSLEGTDKNLKYAERVALKSKHYDAVISAIEKVTDKDVLKKVLKRKDKGIRVKALGRLGTLYKKDPDVQNLLAVIALKPKLASNLRKTALEYANQKTLKQFILTEKDAYWEAIDIAVNRLKDINFLKKQCIKPEAESNLLHACLGRKDVAEFADLDFLETLYANAMSTGNETNILKEVVTLLPLTSQDAFKKVVESLDGDDYTVRETKTRAIRKIKDQKYLYDLFVKSENDLLRKAVIETMSSPAISKLFDELNGKNISEYNDEIVKRSVKLKNKKLMLKLLASNVDADCIRELLEALPVTKDIVKILKSKKADKSEMGMWFWDWHIGEKKAKFYKKVFNIKEE